MGVRVFITLNSGNQKVDKYYKPCKLIVPYFFYTYISIIFIVQIENAQQTILQVLKTRNIDHETVDIAAPGMQVRRGYLMMEMDK